MQEAHLQYHNFYCIWNVSSRRTLKGKEPPPGLVCIASRSHKNAFKIKGFGFIYLKMYLFLLIS